MANPNIVSVTGITAGTLGWNLPTGGLVNLIDPDTGYLLKINRIVVANVDGTSAATVDVAIVTSIQTMPNTTVTGADATTYLAKTINVPADSSLVVSDTPIYLREGDNLQANASASGDLDLTITFKVTGATGVVIPPNGSVLCYQNGTDFISSGMPSTKGSAGVLGAQPAYGLPSSDGTSGQALVTDGAGSVTFGSAGISTGKAIAMAMIFG